MKKHFLSNAWKKVMTCVTSVAMVFTSVGISTSYNTENVEAAVTGLPFVNNLLVNLL